MAAALMGPACGNGDGNGGGPAGTATITVGGESVPVSSLVDGFAGLCDASGSAARRDFPRAKVVFTDRAHTPLHTVARALEDVDRRAAARLLEAKQRVEADLDGSGTNTPGLADDMAALVAATRAGLDRLGIDTQECQQP